jgi:predicted nucleic acid-binding protein
LDKKSEKGGDALNRILQSGEEIATTTINMHEILYVLNKYAKPTKETLLLPTLSYTKKDAVLSSRMEFEAEKRGTSIRRTDAMITAITINNGATLYIRPKAFQVAEDTWTQAFHTINKRA